MRRSRIDGYMVAAIVIGLGYMVACLLLLWGFIAAWMDEDVVDMIGYGISLVLVSSTGSTAVRRAGS